MGFKVLCWLAVVPIALLFSCSDNRVKGTSYPVHDSAPAVSSQAPPSPGKWRVSTGTSSFDDSSTVSLRLSAENAISGWPGYTRTPELVLICKEKKTNAYINTGLQPKVEYGTLNEAKMRARYDKGQVFHYMMLKSTDGEALFFQDAVPEIRYMLKSNDLVAEFIPFNSSSAEMRFDLRGLSDVIGTLRETCGW